MKYYFVDVHESPNYFTLTSYYCMYLDVDIIILAVNSNKRQFNFFYINTSFIVEIFILHYLFYLKKL